MNIDYNMGTATFMVNLETSASKETLKGMFQVKCILSPLEYISAEGMYRELLGKTNPQHATEYVGNLCYALSQLKYRVTLCPSWFEGDNGMKGNNVEDNILLHVLDKAVEAEEKYRKDMTDRSEKAKEEVVAALDDGSLTDPDLNDIDEEEEKES